MAQFVKLVPENLKALREVNPRLMSYNVEFAEVTGGTFWKAYTPEQVAGTEEFHVAPSADGIAAMYKDLMQVYAPIDLYTTRSSAPSQRSSEPHGCVCPAPGQPRLTMILTMQQAVLLRRAT